MMSWQNQITEGISTAAQLAAAIGLTPEKEAEIARITERYPMMITPYYLSLVDKNDPDDPIARMCIPSMDEFGEGGSFDTSGESSNTKMDGLQHKYKPTVLLLSTNVCAMYCRHCFRKRLVGLSDDELLEVADEAIAYITSHGEVNNVLVTGGDALMNPNHVIERYLSGLTAIDHLDLYVSAPACPSRSPSASTATASCWICSRNTASARRSSSSPSSTTRAS